MRLAEQFYVLLLSLEALAYTNISHSGSLKNKTHSVEWVFILGIAVNFNQQIGSWVL